MHYELTQLVLPSLGTVGRCSLSERNEESNGSGEVPISALLLHFSPPRRK